MTTFILMGKWLFVFILVVQSFIGFNFSYAQKPTTPFFTRYLKTGTTDSIPVQKLHLRRNIYTSKIIDDGNLLVVIAGTIEPSTGQWRTSAKIITIDLNEKKIRFVKKLKWSSFELTTKNILINTVKSIQALSYEDGHLLWEKEKSQMLYVNDSLDFWIDQTGYFNSINDGKFKWMKPIPRFHAVEDIKILDNQTILISASGLHWVNLKTGLYKSIPIATSKPYYKGRIINTTLFIASILGSAIAGTPVGFSQNESRNIYQISSNILVDSQSIYIAGMESLVRLTLYGNRIWSAPLSVEQTGIQLLFPFQGTIAYINTGLSKGDSKSIITGHPEIKLFNIENGVQLHAPSLSVGGDHILDVTVQPSSIQLLFPSCIAIMDAKRPAILLFYPLKGMHAQPFRFVDCNRNFYKKINGNTQVMQNTITGQPCICIMDNKKTVYAYNIDKKSLIQMEQGLFSSNTSSPENEIYSNKDETCFTNHIRNSSRCIPISGKMQFSKEQIIITKKKEIYLLRTADFN